MIYARWTGTYFEPLQRHHNVLAAEMVIGQIYRLDIDNERSMASHKHEFASLHEAWVNLPEDIAAEYKTDEHFRKRLLIQEGFYTQKDMTCGSMAEAARWVKELSSRDDYAAYSVDRNIIIERVAKSQSVKAMGKADFQRSKQAILDAAWSLVGISPETARKNQGRAA